MFIKYQFCFTEAVFCGEPELPVAAQVVVIGDASSQTAIYSCEAGYRLLAEPNRTCEADGRWTGHAPQCQGGRLLSFSFTSLAISLH